MIVYIVNIFKSYRRAVRERILMSRLNEELLNVWLQLSTVVNNGRVATALPYNESLICHILHTNEQQSPDKPMTATALCKATRMLKSQMNRTLSSMEKKGFISRQRAVGDRRQIYVRLNAEKIKPYETQHSQILESLDTIIDKIGEDKTKETIGLLGQFTNIAREVFK